MEKKNSGMEGGKDIVAGFLDGALVRTVMAGALILILMIPATMIGSLVRERRSRKCEATAEIAAKWGGVQRLAGPVLIVPVIRKRIDEKGVERVEREAVAILPDSLDVACDISPEIRYRGIYEVVVYTAKIKIKGSFEALEGGVGDAAGGTPDWSKARLVLGISDPHGLRNAIRVDFDGETRELSPDDVGTACSVFKGVGVDLPGFKHDARHAFSAELELAGSGGLYLAPVGRETDVKMDSSWSSPSFTGTYLPKRREVGPAGFSSEWKVFSFNRGYPRILPGNRYGGAVAKSMFGVSLFIENDIYNQAIRSVKYAVLFVTLTFAALILAEIGSGGRLHPVQYLLTGCAVVMFYSLLIAISEHLGFATAYLLSGAAILSAIFLYLKAALSKLAAAVAVSGVQTASLAYFYITLSLQDYALLMGSLGLFSTLVALMFATRRMNSRTRNKKNAKGV
jgi:inner membrane protein